MSVRNNYMHDNGQLGLSLYGESDAARGGQRDRFQRHGRLRDAVGGRRGKFIRTTRLTVRNNYVHDNRGIAFCTDSDNINIVYDNNRIYDNSGTGILVETGYQTRSSITTTSAERLRLHRRPHRRRDLPQHLAERRDLRQHDRPQPPRASASSPPTAARAPTAPTRPGTTTSTTTRSSSSPAAAPGSRATTSPTTRATTTASRTTTTPSAGRVLRRLERRQRLQVHRTRNGWVAAGYDTTGTFTNGC